jgi:lysophospholipase L1-like esterase
MQRNLVSLLWLFVVTSEGRFHRQKTLRAVNIGHSSAFSSRSNHSQGQLHSLALSSNGSKEAKVSVCPFGDSLTDGLQGHDDVYVNVGGFRPALETKLEAQGAELLGFRQCPCHAYPTATALQLHQQLQKTSYKCGSESGLSRYPDIALLLIGTNDLYRGVKVEQSMSEVRSMLTELWEHSRSTEVLLASVPVHPSNPGPFIQYNQALKNLVVELQNAGHRRNIEYVAMQEKTSLCTSSTCHYDHIHPNKAGYAQMADVWWDAIQPKLKARKSVVESQTKPEVNRQMKPERASAQCSAGAMSLALVTLILASL